MKKKREKITVSAELEQEVSNQLLEVEGTIPVWLSGTLVRNGPVKVMVNGVSNTHWFDGLAMLHAFSFDGGKVHYTNKFLRSDAYRKVFDEGSLDYEGFAADPCRSLFQRFLTFLIPSSSVAIHNANVNVAKLADTFVALTEVPLPVQFDLHTLETLGVLNYQDDLPKERCWESAHPHVQEKITSNYLVKFGATSYYTVYALEAGSKERKVLTEIPVDNPAYMHSFSLTENYIIFTEYPFVVKSLDLITGKRPFIKNYAWQPGRGTRFTVVSRNDGRIVGQYLTRPFFAFHHANAFEEGDTIYLDIVTYKDARIITGENLYIGADRILEESDPSQLERFSLSLKTAEIRSDVLFAKSNEFPRINEAFDGKAYRYVYVAGFNDAMIDQVDVQDAGLYKINTQTKDVLAWSEKNCSSGEPVFIAGPDPKDEDDGVVLALILDRLHLSSFLLILDAKTFQEIGRARAPHAVPEGLHGQFFN